MVEPVFGAGFEAVVPLAILLVLAASLLGITAPIYPVMYAVNRPGLAIIARGTGMAIYIVSCIIMCVTVGQMGPGWAALLGNGIAVIIAAVMAKRVLAHYTAPDTDPVNML